MRDVKKILNAGHNLAASNDYCFMPEEISKLIDITKARSRADFELVADGFFVGYYQGVKSALANFVAELIRSNLCDPENIEAAVVGIYERDQIDNEVVEFLSKVCELEALK